jgi:hypothetical protein
MRRSLGPSTHRIKRVSLFAWRREKLRGPQDDIRNYENNIPVIGELHRLLSKLNCPSLSIL